MIKTYSRDNIYRYTMVDGLAICACCGAHYFIKPPTWPVQFCGIAVSDRVLAVDFQVEPVTVMTKNGPLYLYLKEGSTT